METSDLKGKTNIQGGKMKYIILNLNVSLSCFIRIQLCCKCVCACAHVCVCVKSWEVLVGLQIYLYFLEQLAFG